MALVKVDTSAIIKGRARKEYAWGIVSDYMRYPDIMANVDEVIIQEKDDKYGKSEWFVTIEDAPLTWLERDFFDSENLEVRFESIAGDFDVFNGKWKVSDYPNVDGQPNEGIRIDFEVEYNLGIPVIEEVLGHILKEKIQGNIDSMIHAIKADLTKSTFDERKYPRYQIGKYCDILYNGRKLHIYVVDISRKGMFFYYSNDIDNMNAKMQINGVTLETEAIFNDITHRNARIVFKEVQESKVVDHLIKEITKQDPRKYKRIVVQKDITVISGKSEFSVHLQNISPEGMLISYRGSAPKMEESIKIDDFEVEIRNCIENPGKKTCRVVFRRELDDNMYNELIDKLKE